MTYALRTYQQRGLDDLRHACRNGHKRILLCAPTGSGKTVIASHLIELSVAKGFQCLFMAHARELIHQCCEKLTENDITHGVIMAGEQSRSDYFAPVQVVSKDTLYSRVIRREVMQAPEAHLLILDECHRSVSPTWLKLIEAYPNAIIIGLSATPCRSDGKGLGDIYTHMVTVSSYKELIAEGALVKTRVFAPYRPDLRGVKITAGDYNQKQLEGVMDKRVLVGNIYETWRANASDRQTVIFATGIAHSLHIYELFNQHGVKCEHLDGTTPILERDHILRQLRLGEIQVVTNCNVLTEGWDCPPCSCAVLASPTKSILRYRQRAGRIQRPAPGKDDALIIDHSGGVYEHGYPDEDIPWTLDRSTKIEKRVRKEKGEPKIIVCRKCDFAFQSLRFCPNCGEPIPVRQPRIVKFEPGELNEVKRRRALQEATKDEKQSHWDKCVGIAINRRQKIGAASHMYKSRYGVWPRGLLRMPRAGTQWKMEARKFYELYIVPAKTGAYG